jgi:hypothetical protein
MEPVEWVTTMTPRNYQTNCTVPKWYKPRSRTTDSTKIKVKGVRTQ